MDSDPLGEVRDGLVPAENESPTTTTCWRCAQEFPLSQPKCPHCNATNRSLAIPNAKADVAQSESPAIVRVIWAFAALAGLSIAAAFLQSFDELPSNPESYQFAVSQLTTIGILTILSAIITGIAFFLIPLNPSWPQQNLRGKAFAWLAAPPLLLGGLAINFFYHSWLFETVMVEDVLQTLVSHSSLFPWLVLLICISPAILEEVFFRHMALGALLEVVSPLTAVIFSAMLFALAHLGAPLSLPTLFVLGLILGYLRLKSGSLLLPMLVHFLHNFVVILLDHPF